MIAQVTSLKKRSIIVHILFAGVFAAIFIGSLVLLIENHQEIKSAELRSLLAVQSRDRTEAILFASRQDMLERERNIFYGGLGLGLIGLLGSYYMARKRRQQTVRSDQSMSA